MDALDALYIVADLLSGAMACFVVWLGPRRPVTYLLAGVLLFVPIRELVWWAESLFVADYALSFNYRVGMFWLTQSFPLLYVAFVARAVDAPLARRLRHPVATAALVALAVLAVGLPAFAPELVFDLPAIRDADGWTWRKRAGLFWQVQSPALYFAIALLGLAAALQAWSRSPIGSSSRGRAQAYFFAFALYDLQMLVGSAYTAGTRVTEVPAVWEGVSIAIDLVALLAFPVLLARALLRHHLLDFDLRLKWTVRRGTLVAIVVAPILIVAEIAQIYVSSSLGVVAGIATAIVLFFAKRPLERFAERVANATLPHVEDTAEYRTVRKREVYRAAVESALEDGVVTERERGVLATLAAQLELGADEAARIEREAARGV